MKQFEATFRDGYEFFERVYDTDLKRSVKNKINLHHEWFEPSSKGLYSFILDDTIKLEKKQGRAKEGRDQYGFLDPMYRNIRDNYWNTKTGYNINPRVWYLDIETRTNTCSTGFPVPEKALEPISLIQFYDNVAETMIVLGLRDWKHQDKYKFPYSVKYVKCNDEIHLLNTFVDIFNKLDPLIIYAWFGLGFDYPYIHNRMKRLGLDTNKLSNYGAVSYNENLNEKGQMEFKFKSDGHFFIDLKDVYEKFTFEPRPNYQLNTIAEIELNENKVQHTEYTAFDDFYTGKYNIPYNPTEEQKNSDIYKAAIAGDWDEVRELAHSEFVFYGCTDTYLICRIDKKLNFTTLMLMISEKMGVQVGDSMGTVKPWSQYLANRSMQNMQVMPPKRDYPQPDVVGGFVRDPIIGKHKWVLSADVNSMYPLLGMVGFNMSPETYVPVHKLPTKLRDIIMTYFNDQNESRRLDLKEDVWDAVYDELIEHNLSLAINGAIFSKEKLGMIPELVMEISSSRKKAQAELKRYKKQHILIEQILKERHG